jgi:hypothetical protein
MNTVSLNPANNTIGANTLQADNNFTQATGLEALRESPSFTFAGAEGLGDQAVTNLKDAGTLIGGDKPWMLGQVWYIPDSIENKVFGRNVLGNGEAYTVKNGIYSFYDKNGNFIGNYKQVTEENATKIIKSKSTSNSANMNAGVFNIKGGSDVTTVTTFLAPVK